MIRDVFDRESFVRSLESIYITISTFTSVRPSSVARHVTSRHTFDFQIPAVVSQSGINKSCLTCVKSEKYAFLGTTRPLGSMRWREAKITYITTLGEKKPSYVY